ncbi:hypothetical protein ABVK25_010073 [Lepraria finkii]|uniref:Chromo domain-containing protein n=1 Tax=Lepraria finkii TaxID=1340010 RepID=A0ABR4B1I8_9LECA
MESEISAIHLQKHTLREQPKTHGCLSPITEPTTQPITEPTTSPVDRPISPSIALYRDPVEQAIRGGDRKAAPTIYPLHAIAVTPPLPEQPQDQRDSALDEEEWEIVRIVSKRRRGKGNEYKVYWKRTWLLEYKLGKAQELVREFEVKRQAQRGGK